MLTKLLMTNKKCLRPNSFSNFSGGFKSLLLRHNKIPVFVQNTGISFTFPGFPNYLFAILKSNTDVRIPNLLTKMPNC